jgi:hypothetical protein
MTIQKYLKCSAEELEKMTDQQLAEFFAPVLQFSRPDPNAMKLKQIDESVSPAQKSRASKKAQEDKMQRLLVLAEKMGVS